MPHCALTNLKDLLDSLMCNLVDIIGPRQRSRSLVCLAVKPSKTKKSCTLMKNQIQHLGRKKNAVECELVTVYF